MKLQKYTKKNVKISNLFVSQQEHNAAYNPARALTLAQISRPSNKRGLFCYFAIASCNHWLKQTFYVINECIAFGFQRQAVGLTYVPIRLLCPVFVYDFFTTHLIIECYNVLHCERVCCCYSLIVAAADKFSAASMNNEELTNRRTVAEKALDFTFFLFFLCSLGFFTRFSHSFCP